MAGLSKRKLSGLVLPTNERSHLFNSFSRLPTTSRLSFSVLPRPDDEQAWMESSNEQEVTFPGRPMILARLSPGFVKGTFLYSPL